MDSLFVALRSYRPTPKRNPTEDFITEAWAWLLRNEAGLCALFEAEVRALIDAGTGSFAQCPSPPLEFPSGWRQNTARTQVSTGGGRADMVIDTEDGGVVFEHKTWSNVHGNQLEKYRGWGADAFGDRHLLVFVTASRSQWVSLTANSEAGPHVEMTWGFIERVCGQHAETAASRLVSDFVELLRSQGLGAPGPLSEESLRAYGPALQVVPRLRSLWKSLAEDANWATTVYAKLLSQGDDRAPCLRWKRGERPREGRFGIHMFAWWRPGIFVGAVLDPADQRLDLSTSHLGPDFALILSYSREADANPGADEFWKSKEVSSLRARLCREHGSWDLVDRVATIGEPDVNPWHPIHLRRPLVDVLRATTTFEAQRAALLDASNELLDLLLRGGELAAWVERVRDAVPPDERR